MYLYLLENRHNQKIEINLKELKDVLGCNEDSYKEFEEFENHVLKKVQKEINEVTDASYEYELIQDNDIVTGIRFVIHER